MIRCSLFSGQEYTERNMNYLKLVCKPPRTILKKIQKTSSSRTVDAPIFVSFKEGSKPTNILTDKQEIHNHLELVYKHPRNVKKNQKDVSSKPGDIPIFGLFY